MAARFARIYFATTTRYGFAQEDVAFGGIQLLCLEIDVRFEDPVCTALILSRYGADSYSFGLARVHSETAIEAYATWVFVNLLAVSTEGIPIDRVR